MGYDEAFEIPSEEAVTLSLRTQQIVALESGVPRTVDPLGGSYYVEALTDELEARANDVLDEIDELGGAVAAIEQGVSQRWIAASAYRIEREIADGIRPRVGRERARRPERERRSRCRSCSRSTRRSSDRQVARTAARVARRDAAACADGHGRRRGGRSRRRRT